MIQTTVFTPVKLPSKQEKQAIVDFLFQHLEQFGDPAGDIEKAVDYALKISDSFGGFVLAGHLDNELVGAVVVNRTGMSGYIPENILVYIATHRKHRGKGHGKALMKKTIELAEGAVALHVEPDNPARYLYEKVGFTNKYLEMRLVN
jgi:GNAT superfamily N-acetyltransferase